MKVEVIIRDKKKKITLPDNSRMKSLLEKINAKEEEYVFSRNGKIVLSDEKLKEGDKIKLFPVISGG